MLTAQEPLLAARPTDGTPVESAPPRVFPKFQVRSVKTYQLKDQQLTIQAVAAPSLPQAIKNNSAPLSERELAEYRKTSEFQKFLAARKTEASENPYELILLSATVFDREHTYLRWWNGRQAYEAWSNLDFNNLGGFVEFKSGKKRYGLIMGLGNATNAKTQGEPLPPYPQALQAEDAPAFLLIAGDEENIEALAGIEALHQLYANEEETLVAATQGREEAQRVREADLKANPPQKPNITIQVWPKEGSRHFQRNKQGKETGK